MLSLGELEELRDELAERVEDSRRALSDRTYVEELNRRRIEEMLLEPEKHKWVRVGNEDIGEPGCKHWHVRPRWGILGMLHELVAGPDLLRLSVSHLTPAWARAAASEPPRRGARHDARRARRRAPRARRARRRRRSAAAGVRPTSARPRPGGSFPLVELLVLAGIVLMVWGVVSWDDERQPQVRRRAWRSRRSAGLELSVREHFAGYRSHTTLLAGVARSPWSRCSALGIGLELWMLLPRRSVFGARFYGLRRSSSSAPGASPSAEAARSHGRERRRSSS